jgi:predicted amidohydrolase
MRDKIRIAGVQMNPKIMEVKENFNKIVLQIKTAAHDGAKLIVFPECALTGYAYRSLDEATPFMETVPGSSTDKLITYCKELGVYVVVGLLEIMGNKHFNTAVLIGPEGIIGRHRKKHLPFMGVDRFLDRSDEPFQVYKTTVGNIGMHICYECNFPEAARVMALSGADILVLPTNWLKGREKNSKYVVNSRAFENKTHFIAVSRVGEERGVEYLGNSKIVDSYGDTLAKGDRDGEQIIYANVSLEDAQKKKIFIKRGELELDLLNDRRPGLYDKITEPIIISHHS